MNKRQIQVASLLIGLALSQAALATTVLWLGNGHYYETMTDEAVPWETAKQHAESMSFQGASGYLATITSQEEQSFIEENVINPVGLEFWIGGYQPEGSSEPDGDWTWVTGETWSYTHWGIGEPGPTGEGENHLTIYQGYRFGYWNDDGGSKSFNYIVEYTPIPEPSLAILLAGLLGFMRNRI